MLLAAAAQVLRKSKMRVEKRELAYLDTFGQSTVISLLEANEIQQPFTRIASGGVRDAYDIFKALA